MRQHFLPDQIKRVLYDAVAQMQLVATNFGPAECPAPKEKSWDELLGPPLDIDLTSTFEMIEEYGGRRIVLVSTQNMNFVLGGQHHPLEYLFE